MTGSEVMDVAQDAIFTLLAVAGPIMIAALVVGLIIAVFQALTQIQEMTLTFVPKIIAIFLALLFFIPMMAANLTGLMDRMVDRISNIS
ncbi:MAG: flagellar biosynthesis protein FliQ [Alphaproteobacteria bacterium]|jgi:flagellar biosynthesis protein FliQ|nr:flagellar biosynthesis protein FliQ [Alphaproteobacteria bacterium]MBT4017950.1 flagellar biosynthesis protein FliQ [Alphaproteobacteria bacterium]MBT4966403.1 flagellar biosynthesis protein FliQ [Alphaproteobacteria bacterium]MBT6385434.1 flagellar biosynthesis protein FliQ [Alphaproteobacteria bacterium]MBT7748132.1 flagellar biosynthesis protein FliQ [Alphaproteobacteria bacterium]